MGTLLRGEGIGEHELGRIPRREPRDGVVRVSEHGQPRREAWVETRPVDTYTPRAGRAAPSPIGSGGLEPKRELCCWDDERRAPHPAVAAPPFEHAAARLDELERRIGRNGTAAVKAKPQARGAAR